MSSSSSQKSFAYRKPQLAPAEVTQWRGAIRKDWRQLQFAPLPLRGDAETVLSAVVQDHRAMKFASPEVSSDPAAALRAVKLNGQALQFLSEDLKADRHTLMTAVQQDWRALRGVYSKLHSTDRDIAVAGAKQSWRALEFVDLELLADREFMLETLHTGGWQAVMFAPEELRGDREFMLEAVKMSGDALRYGSESLQRDPELRGFSDTKISTSLGECLLPLAEARHISRPEPGYYSRRDEPAVPDSDLLAEQRFMSEMGARHGF
mmetsp:Transcript_25980/g.60057  ORF Transcript_25980/g.60057 Transcript_25980/m.60057 type:complete len:264 (-) Transcript_25980:93-884(-)